MEGGKNMEDLARRAMETALSSGATYADIRIVEINNQNISSRNGKIRNVSIGKNKGFGVRVLIDGAWGFSSSCDISPNTIEKVTLEAAKIAKASARLKKKDVRLAPAKPIRGTYKTPLKKDPFEVPLKDKIEILIEADKRVISQSNLLKLSTSSMNHYREGKVFANSEGAYITQEITWCSANSRVTAIGYGEYQDRSFDGRNARTGGYEIIEGIDLPARAEESGKEALKLLTAKNCPEMITDVIVGGSQLALQVHESTGHPTELDRALGAEAAMAGTSFLTVDKMGKFRYGSKEVNIVADATIPDGLGTFGYDDEGVPAQRVYLIKGGIFVNYLSDRTFAGELGVPSTGAARASGWNRIPLVRMTNINLEPRNWEFDELVKDTKKGIYMETNRSWSIDDKRLNFQFGTQMAYLIEKGELTDLIKNAVYTGITPEFWGSCDAICNKKHWHMWGTPGCGKGQPGQVMYVGHGTAPARFRNTRVFSGVTR